MTLDEGYSKCNYCNTEITPEHLLDLFEEHSSAIYCAECGEAPASVISVGDGYVCLCCFTYFGDTATSQCQWCMTEYAGDIGENTGYFGCGQCGGAKGERGDKD